MKKAKKPRNKFAIKSANKADKLPLLPSALDDDAEDSDTQMAPSELFDGCSRDTVSAHRVGDLHDPITSVAASNVINQSE